MCMFVGEREIKELGVRCSSRERGCPWTGTIGTLDTHLATCEYLLVTCPNKCEDDKDGGQAQLMRKDLEEHVQSRCLKRPFECSHCGEKGTYAGITVEHYKVCDKKMVACPNQGSGCLLSMERGKTKRHVSVCEFIKVSCAYESLGCGVRMMRKDVEKHKREAREKHLDLALDTVSSREEQHKTLSEGEALVFKLPGYACKKEKDEIFYSTPFYTHPGGYKVIIRVYANGVAGGAGTHVSVFTKISEGRYDNQLSWPFKGSVTYQLLNQLADDRHHHIVSIFTDTTDMQVGSCTGPAQFLPHSSLCPDPATNPQYLLDDTLYFRVSVKVDNHKPWLVCTDKINLDSIKTINNNKSLKDGEQFIFKVTGYSARKATPYDYFSDSFYTSPGGFNMWIRIYPNGYDTGTGTHISVLAKLLEGSYDASLSWPFLGTVTFTLLNELSDENHHTKTLKFNKKTDRNIGDGRGYPRFISQSALSHDPEKNTQYLKNDTLYFRVSVQVKDSKPWLTCTNE